LPVGPGPVAHPHWALPAPAALAPLGNYHRKLFKIN
jgi:hypothetical protein